MRSRTFERAPTGAGLPKDSSLPGGKLMVYQQVPESTFPSGPETVQKMSKRTAVAADPATALGWARWGIHRHGWESKVGLTAVVAVPPAFLPYVHPTHGASGLPTPWCVVILYSQDPSWRVTVL